MDFPDWLRVSLIRSAANSSSNYKVCGPDEIKLIKIKHLLGKVVKLLQRIFDASLRLAYFPREWLLSRMVLILKPGWDDYSEAKKLQANLPDFVSVQDVTATHPLATRGHYPKRAPSPRAATHFQEGPLD